MRNNIFDNEQIDNSKLLVVQFAEFVKSEKLYWQELFEGFTDLKVITFSSSLNFVNQVIPMFENSEIIFGCEAILNKNHYDVLRAQSSVMNLIAKDKNVNKLLKFIDEGSLSLYVLNNSISHQKIFLLSNKTTGRKRVITGSCNMSQKAFGGIQKENIIVFDDEKGFDENLRIFNDIKSNSSSDISSDVIRKRIKAELSLQDENASYEEVLPALENPKANITIEISEDDRTEEVQTAFDLNFELLGENERKLLRKFAQKDANGRSKIVISKDLIGKIKKIQKDHFDEKVKTVVFQRQLPNVKYDYENHSVFVNGTELDMNPSIDDIEKDVRILRQYFSGFYSAHGDVKGSVFSFYRFMVWWIASPFITRLRYKLFKAGHRPYLDYPVYGLLYGRSNCGKTSFVEFLSKMTTGVKQYTPLHNSDFTERNVNKWRMVAKGLPIFVDDVKPSKLKSSIEMVKSNDEFGVSEDMYDYSTVAITSNYDKALEQAVLKRVATCYVDAALENEDGYTNHAEFEKLYDKIGTAFYRECCKRLFDEVEYIEMQWLCGNMDVNHDILQITSNVISDIFRDFKITTDWIRPVDVMNYFSSEALAETTFDNLQDSLAVEPKLFEYNISKDILIYRIPQNGNRHKYEQIAVQLPKKCLARVEQTGLTMRLSAVKDKLDLSNAVCVDQGSFFARMKNYFRRLSANE